MKRRDFLFSVAGVALAGPACLAIGSTAAIPFPWRPATDEAEFFLRRWLGTAGSKRGMVLRVQPPDGWQAKTLTSLPPGESVITDVLHHLPAADTRQFVRRANRKCKQHGYGSWFVNANALESYGQPATASTLTRRQRERVAIARSVVAGVAGTHQISKATRVHPCEVSATLRKFRHLRIAPADLQRATASNDDGTASAALLALLKDRKRQQKQRRKLARSIVPFPSLLRGAA